MNVISASLSLLRIVGSEDETPYAEVHSLYRISDIDVDDLLEMLTVCRLIVKHSENLILSDTGTKVLLDASDNYDKGIRVILREYVLHTEPIWSKRIPYGRCEATTFMTKDEKSCFYEAGLLDEYPDYGVVLWWDNLSEIIRKRVDALKNETGRSGEKCTIAFETERVDKKPLWRSIDSNMLGYDIMSVASQTDNTPLLIEVKTSADDMEHAYFHISSNEWRVATHVTEYAFYLWNLCGGKKKLAIVKPKEMSSHMPENKESGEWESVKIPFKSFIDKFTEWSGSI
ncbi:MAG: DUF3883 domain-containing protein [Eubacteriales bacterium]|nr:DUF3883 domain-containing protein [Eubacteriales bacterium]